MTPATVATVPNVEKTPRRTIRVPDDDWAAAKARAAERNETLTDVVLRALRAYVEEET